jgi:hypothetical protein
MVHDLLYEKPFWLAVGTFKLQTPGTNTTSHSFGQIWYSSDGRRWTKRCALPTPSQLRAIAAGPLPGAPTTESQTQQKPSIGRVTPLPATIDLKRVLGRNIGKRPPKGVKLVPR